VLLRALRAAITTAGYPLEKSVLVTRDPHAGLANNLANRWSEKGTRAVYVSLRVLTYRRPQVGHSTLTSAPRLY
jgi:hypothetical protein